MRPAATVLLLRDDPGGLHVFMVRRHHAMGFAGDARVFPGGRIDESDIALAARHDLCPPVAGLDRHAMAFRVGALRETFEESGVLLARAGGAQALIGHDRAQALAGDRQAVCEDGGRFAALLVREGLVLAPDVLAPFAHWITPVIYPKRYDTMFFLAAAPYGQIAAHDGTESVDSLWVTPSGALSDGEKGRCKLEFATRRNLEKLGRHRTAEDALAAARGADIVTVVPLIEDGPQGRTARLPPEAGYGGAVFDFAR